MNSLQKTLHRLSNLSFPQVLLIGGVLAGVVFLWGHYQNQLVSALPYLILLLCPLMHVFMHRGHGGHGKDVTIQQHPIRSLRLPARKQPERHRHTIVFQAACAHLEHC